MSEILLLSTKTKLNSRIPSNKKMDEEKNIISIIDKSLKHLNQISEANIVAQELYIQLLKEKKTMKFDQIKKIYLTLTQSKAKQILFQRDKQELIKTDYQNHEGLIRLCWRSIQKLIKKITYYMINENNLSPISKSVLSLIQFNQHFVRRFQKIKNSSMLFVIQMMQKLIQQNSILEKKIYDILLNRGYVVSLDQFYKLNGYDAEHREAYEAKQKFDVKQKISERENKSPCIRINNQSFSSNLKRTLGRKKKLFKFQNRNHWKQNFLLQEKQQKKSFPVNKTNFQIRQSFEKYIGDFLHNQNLREILISYQNQQQAQKKRKNSQKKKQDLLNEDKIIEKKIFQNKIQSVITQLKSNNIMINSKLLEIIENSSTEAINSKLNQNGKRLSERKNSHKRQSSLNAQKKIRQSYSINDRKLVNQNLYRELLKRNKSIQNFLTEEIFEDNKQIKKQYLVTDLQQNSTDTHVIQQSLIEHNQISTQNLNKKSQFSNSLLKKTFMLKSQPKLQKQISSNVLNTKFRLLQNSWTQQKNTENINTIQQLEGNKSFAEKIKIAKEEWAFKNQNHILQAIQKAQINPLNPFNIAQILKSLDCKKDLKNNPLLKQSYSSRPKTNPQLQRTSDNHIKTQNGQKIRNKLKIRDMTSDFDLLFQKTYQENHYQRVKTQASPSKMDYKKFFERDKINDKIYQVFDCRMRRMIRRQSLNSKYKILKQKK